MRTLDDILAQLTTLPEDQQQAMFEQAQKILGERKWLPNPGPQTAAYHSKADILLYGGAGGGGKTDLICGLALSEHQKTLVLRRQYTDLGGIIDRMTSVAGTRKGLNKSPPPVFEIDGRKIDFGAATDMDKAMTWQGRPHDLIAFDEACQFQEDVVRFLMGWNRAADDELGVASSQRCRVVMASNPPLSAEGDWVIGFFRPWLDVSHPNPAAHGELRWYVTDPDGRDVEVDGPTDGRTWDGKDYEPKSRTFIPAMLSDNPHLAGTGYQATVDAMPEPMRSAIRDGNFMAAREDDAFQVIPSDWVRKAMQRWREKDSSEVKSRQQMTALGVDVARGGRDFTVLSPRYGVWFDELIKVPGRDTPDGPSVAGLAAMTLRDSALIGLDAIGVGADAETSMRAANLPFEAINGASKAHSATRDGNFHFVTKRSEMWWMLREALDPVNGFDIALPPDPALEADLCAPTYEVRPGDPAKIYVESKQDIIKRLGRSPDAGDSVVYAWAVGGLEGVGRHTIKPALYAPKARTNYDARRY